MKTIVLVFLSLFLTKTCQSKKDLPKPEPTTQNAAVVEVVPTENIQKEETKPEVEPAKVQTGTKIEYEALSRGFYNKFIYENSAITIISQRDSKGESVKLSKKDVSDIMLLVKGIKLETMSTLKAPTDARAYDGAANGNITITTNGKEYVGPGFDAGTPPKELVKIIDKILSFRPKK
jgi:uncharacterized protein YcfL